MLEDHGYDPHVLEWQLPGQSCQLADGAFADGGVGRLVGGGRIHEEVVGPAGQAGLGVGLGRAAGWCRRRRRGGEPEVAQDGGEDGQVGEVGQDAQGTATALAAPNVQAVNATKPLGPGEAARARGGRGGRRGEGVEEGGGRVGGRGHGRGRRRAGGGREPVVGRRRRGPARRRAGERGTTAGVGGEAARVSGQVDAWRGHQRGQAAEELDGGEDELTRTVGEGAFHAVVQAAVVARAEALGGERGAQAVTTQALESLAVVLVEGEVRVQREIGRASCRERVLRLV